MYFTQFQQNVQWSNGLNLWRLLKKIAWFQIITDENHFFYMKSDMRTVSVVVQLIAAKSPLSWTWREKGRIATGDSNRLNRRWLIPKWPDRTNLICEKTYRAFALPERMKRFVSMSMKDALIYILSVLFGAWPSSAQRKASSLLPKRTTWTL